MNIQQLRKSLKTKWLKYYHQNRSWLAKMRIWGNYDGYRRPYSGFILATLSVLEPKLDDILPFILELNNNPDEIIAALGLNFNPEEQLDLINNLNESVNNSNVNSNHIQNRIIVDKCKAEKTDERENNQATTSVSTAITKIESFPLPQEIASKSQSLETEFQTLSGLIPEASHQSVSEESIIAQLEGEEEILSLLTMCNETESAGKIVKVSSEKESEKMKSKSRKKVSNLASLIDEFCQGVDWDREEAIFIPY